MKAVCGPYPEQSSIQFFARAIHDLKAPLRAIKNYSDWVREDCVDTLPPDSADHLSKINSRVERMEGLLSNLSLLSEIESIKLNPVDIDVSEVASIVVHRMKQRYPSIHFEVCSGPCKTFADRWILEWIMDCLLSNAAKHRDGAEGKVSIHCLDTSVALQVAVVDDGTGIEEEFLEDVFEPFYMLRSKDEVEGTGLGLTILKKIVDRLDGQIFLRSEPGEGTRATVEI
ncbi:MAG: HAMP domain-containing sensor histidine kinase [Verrucomicrobiales bacterium]|nr:HAMP domain-containing sensor histidine kinase [Verrucomicrobiales bacterium]